MNKRLFIGTLLVFTLIGLAVGWKLGSIAGQTYFAIFNFALVAYLLYVLAGPKIAQGLHAKNSANLRTLEEAETAHAHASQALAEHRRRLANVDQELASILETSRKLATQTAAEIERTAHADAERLKGHAAQEIERERAIARQLIQRTMLQQALESAADALRRSMNTQFQQQLVARFIGRLKDGSCPIQL